MLTRRLAQSALRLSFANRNFSTSLRKMSESAKANTADLTAGKLFNLDGKVALVTGGASGIGLWL